ncbi:MAG: AmmeMemoRadiSam system protein B [Candidatus Aminicenantes bacterium]|nr:AmmeMemoRadiSam system protein B [Candidatus Aminicenantes bacterium]
MEKKCPRLRYDLEFIPVSQEGMRAVLVKDPLGLTPGSLLIKGELLAFVSLLDGTNAVDDIQLILTRKRGGIIFSRGDVERMLEELEEAFLLDGPRYTAEKEKRAADYLRQKERAPALAGRAYPKEASELRKFITDILADGEAGSNGGKIRALIAPHIDLYVGRGVYAQAYASIQNMSPRRIVLLGTGHGLRNGVVCFTEKDFRTPLGLVRTDAETAFRMKNKAAQIASPDDLAHRSEHSLEFQLLFLQVLFGSDFTLLPLLMGAFGEDLQKASRPREVEGIAVFLENMREYINEDSRETLVVAGVDLSHIGPKFGHESPAPALIWEAKRHDEALLRAIEQGDPLSFWEANRKVRDRFNVCGFSVLAFLLELFSGFPAQLLAYDVWHEEATESAVSFAALIVQENSRNQGGQIEG